MEKKTLKRLSSIVIFAVTILAMCGLDKATAAEPIRWKMQSVFPSTSYGHQEFFMIFADLVKNRSKGRLLIDLMPAGALVGSGEAFSACVNNVVQAVGSVGAYHSGVLPEANLEMGLPCNFSEIDQSPEFHFRYNNRLYFKMLDEAYRSKNLHILGLTAYPNSLQTKFPIHKVEDLKGKKIRAVGAVGKTLEALGVSVVNLASAEQYTALQRGTVDGTVMANYATRTYRLMEVTKYISLPPLNIAAHDIFCNLDAYNKLPPDLQKIVDDSGVDASLSYCERYPKLEAADFEEAKKAGVSIIVLPKEEFAKIRNAATPTWEYYMKTPRSVEMVKVLKAYLKDKGE